MSFFKKIFGQKEQASEHNPLDDWRIVKAQNEEKILIMRVRVRKPMLPDLEEHKTLVVISWPYEGNEGTELPNAEDSAGMNNIEDAFFPLTDEEENQNSFMIKVGTGLNLREWEFYAKSQDIFMKTFNELLKDEPKYPISIKFFADPEWQQWAENLRILDHPNATHEKIKWPE